MVVNVATILVVDDEPRIVQLVRDYLEHGGFTVLTASDGPSALRTARTLEEAVATPVAGQHVVLHDRSLLERRRG